MKPEIWKFESVIHHLLFMRVCIAYCIPCFVIGMLGTSKSSVITLLEDRNYKLPEPERLRIHKYMSSKTSSADGIKSQYLEAAFRKLTDSSFMPVIFTDEMGQFR
jgi:hypothetical protein